MADWLLHNEIERQARWRSDDVAFVFEGRTYTYAEFDDRVNRLARGLRDWGVAEGDRVVVHSVNHVDLFTVFYACSKAGAVFSPISTFQSTENVTYITETLDPAAVFYSGGDAIVEGSLRTIRAAVDDAEFISLDDTVGEDGDVPFDSAIEEYPASKPAWADDRTADAQHNIFWTSGTTGRPKGVVRDHASTLHFADGFSHAFPVEDADRRLLLYNMMFIGPYFRDAIVTPQAGGKIVVLRDYPPATICDALQQFDVNTIHISFSLARSWIEYVHDNDVDVDLQYIHTVVKSPDVAQSLYDLCDELYHLYGQTEAGHPMAARLEPPFSNPPTLGKPLPGSDVRVVPVDAEFGTGLSSRPEPNTDGELVVRSEGAMVRYLDEENQRENVHDGWIYTGDVVEVSQDLELQFKDRDDDRIRSGGVNVYPSEVQRVLNDHPGVADSVVVGVPDEKWGERICALVARTGDVDADELDAHCLASDGLARQLRPREYAFVESPDHIPTNEQNKVDRPGVVSQYF